MKRDSSNEVRTGTHFETLEQRALLAAVTWDGGGNGVDWSDPLNWSTNALPGAADDVTIDAPATVRHTSGFSTVRSLDARSAFQLAGGTLSLADASEIDSGFEFSGGTLAGTADLTLRGSANWTNGVLEGTGKLVVSQGAVLTIAGPTINLWRSLDNAGTLNWTPGQLDMIDSIVTNLPGGVFNATGNGVAQGLSGVTRFVNQGSFVRSGGGATTFNVGVGFNNAGTVVLVDGSLQALGGGVSSGTFVLESTLRVTGTTVYLASSTFTGSGRLEVSSGTTTINGTYSAASIAIAAGTLNLNGPTSLAQPFIVPANTTVNVNGPLTTISDISVSGGTLSVNDTQSWPRLFLSSGELSGSAAITATQRMEITGGIQSGSGQTNISSAAVLQLNSTTTVARTFQNAGTANWAGGQLTLQTATIRNLEGGIWNCFGGSQINDPAGIFSRFENAGLLQTNGNSATFGPNLTFSNTGTVEWLGGGLALQGPVQQLVNGNLAGGTWFARGSGSIGFATAITSNAATIRLRDSGSMSTLSLQSNSGTLEFLANRGWTATAATFVNTGSILVEGGNSGGASTVSNNGTIRLTQNGNLSLLGPGVHSGSFDVQSGELQFLNDHTFTSESTISGAGNLRLALSGPSEIGATITIGGALRLPSGQPIFTTPLTIGRIENSTFSRFDATVSIGDVIAASGSTLEFNATTSIGQLTSWPNASLTGTGNVTITGGGTWQSGTLSGTGAFTVATGATPTFFSATISRPFVNRGTLTIQSGSITLTGTTITNEAGATMIASSSINGSSSSIINRGTVTGGLGIGLGVTLENDGLFVGSGNFSGGRGTGRFTNGPYQFANGYTFETGASLTNASLNNGTYQFDGELAPGTSFNANGATLSFDADQLLGSPNLTASTVVGPGDLTVANLNASGTSFLGDGRLVVTGSSGISGTTTLARNLDLFGSLTLGGTVALDGARIATLFGGQLTLGTATLASLAGQLNEINNSGTLAVNGFSTIQSSVRLTSLGLITLVNGDLTLNSMSTLGGQVTVGDGSQLRLNAVQDFLPDIVLTTSPSTSRIQLNVDQTFVGTLNHAGAISGPGRFSVGGIMNWTGGTVDGTAGTLEVLPSGSVNVTGTVSLIRYLENFGTWTQTSSVQSFSQGSEARESIVNRPGGTFAHRSSLSSPSNTLWIRNQGAWNTQGGTLTARRFTNTSVLSVNGGSFTIADDFVSEVGATFTATGLTHSGPATNHGSATLSSGSNFSNGVLLNTGALTIGTGTVSISTLDHRGTLTINAGATLTNSNSLTAVSGSVSTLNGTLNSPATFLQGSTLTIAGTIDGASLVTLSGNVLWNSGAFNGTGRVAISPTGSVTLSGPGSRTLSRTTDNSGTITISAANVSVSTVLNILPTGTLSLIGNSGFSRASGSPAIQNAGLVTRSGDGTTTFGTGVSFNNAHIARIEAGSLALNGGGLQSGQFDLATNSTLSLAGTHIFSGSSLISSAGTVVVSSGSSTFNSNQTLQNLTLAGGTLRGTGSITITNLVTFSGGDITGTGLLTLASSASTSFGSSNRTINRSVINQGLFDLGVQRITVNGAFTQTSEGRARSQIALRGSPGTFGLLIVNGSASLAGQLVVGVNSGLTLVEGDSFAFVTANAIPSSFEQVPGTVSPGLVWQPATTATQVSLTVLRSGLWTGLGDNVSWSAAANWAGFQLPTGTTDVIIPAGPSAAVSLSGSAWQVRTLTTERPLHIQDGSLSFVGAGLSVINGDLVIGNATLFIPATHRLTVTRDLTSSGTIDLSGELSVRNATLLTDSVVRIHITSSYSGHLLASAAIALDGQLNIVADNAFDPTEPMIPLYDVSLVNASNITGEFAATTLPVPNVGAYKIAQTATGIELLHDIFDYDGNGGVDADDIIAFFAQWDSGSSLADINGDGSVDSDDILAFFAGWDAGGR